MWCGLRQVAYIRTKHRVCGVRQVAYIRTKHRVCGVRHVPYIRTKHSVCGVVCVKWHILELNTVYVVWSASSGIY